MSTLGCGTAAPTTVKVKGTVKFDGQPLTKGAVTFSARDAGEGAITRPAVGQIQSDGSYQLGTFTADDGALPGNYSVIVTSFEDQPSDEEIAQGVKPKSLVPEKYGSAATSGLVATIPKDGPEPVVMDFDLKK